jgi:hypothetical protein
LDDFNTETQSKARSRQRSLSFVSLGLMNAQSIRQLTVLLTALLGSHYAARATEWTDQKAGSTTQLLSIATQLGDIARRQTTHYPEAPVTKRIDVLVKQVAASEDLVRLALLCHAVLGSGMAQHASYDGVFDYAMWHCARLLSQRPGREGELALVRLQPFIGRDGGGALTMRELMEAQKKLTITPPK